MKRQDGDGWFGLLDFLIEIDLVVAVPAADGL